MDDNSSPRTTIPGDLRQIVIIIEHELRRSAKGLRYPLILILALFIPSIIYAAPLASGERYTYDDISETVYTSPYENDDYPEYRSIVWTYHPDIVIESLKVAVNSTYVADDEWEYLAGDGAILLTCPAGTRLELSFDRAISEFDLADRLMYPLHYLIVVVAVLVSADMLVGEIQNRTAYLLLPNPVKRTTIVLSKLFASVIIGTTTLIVFYLTVSCLSFFTLGVVPRFMTVSFGFSALYFLACTSASYALSSCLKTSTGAVVLSFLLLMVISPISQSVSIRYGLKPWFLPSFAGECITTSLRIEDYPEDIVDTSGSVPYYQFYPNPELSIIVLTLYSAVLCGLSIAVFRWRDIKE